MLKKLKLALLATSVMFFPKGIYAADQDKDELKTLALRPTSSSQQPADSLPYVTYGIDGRFNSLLPAFACEPNFDAQLSAGPSSSQINIGSSSSEIDFSLDQFPGGLTIRERALYAEVLQRNIENNIDLKKHFNFSDIQECKEAERSISIIIQFLDEEAGKPLKEVKKKLEELENQFRAQLKTQFKEGLEQSFESVGFTIRLLDLKWASDDKEAEEATKEILSSYSSVLEDLPLYIELFQQKKYAESFVDKVYDKLDEPEGFTEAALADILEETPENSRNLIERMAGPYFKITNLKKSKEQLPPTEKSEIDPEIDQLHGRLTKTSSGWSLFSDVLRSNIGTNNDLMNYFNTREEAGETILIIMELLRMGAEKPLQDIEEELQTLTKSFIKLGDQKVIQLHLDTVDQLDKMLDDGVPAKDFLSFCSDVLKDPKFQGSNIHPYVNLIQQGMFAKDFFEKVDEVEDFTEATLADLLKEIPENSKNLVERIARPYFKMMNLSKAAMQTFPYENEEEATSNSSSPYSNGEVSVVSAAPVEPVVAVPQSIVALASTSQVPFSSSSSLVGSVKTFLTPDDVSFNSTFEIEMGNPIPRGWSLHDGRKGRIGEERTEENPLRVEVIENGKIKIIGDMHNLYYPLPDLKNFAGKEMRFSAKVKSTVPGTRLAYMGKRGDQINSAPHSNREGEETMSLTFKVDLGPTSLNNLYFLGGRPREGIPPFMEISDVKLELVGEKD